MDILEWPDFIEDFRSRAGIPERKTAVTVGVFDGIHRGHRALIDRIIRLSPEYIPTVVSFKKNPKALLHKPEWKGDILSAEQKAAIFKDLGVALLVLIDFSGNFSKLSGRQFIDLLRIRGNLGYLAVGGNFRCGYRLDTDAARIKELNAAAGIPTDIVEPVFAGAHPVSSSLIRGAIAAGDFSLAAELLGRNVEIDLSGIDPQGKAGEVFFDIAARHRVLPPSGRYRVLLYGENSPEGIETEVRVAGGGLYLPPAFNPVRVEFYYHGYQGV
jgi:riboflavin kinase/FMN adenylyltransferase